MSLRLHLCATLTTIGLLLGLAAHADPAASSPPGGIKVQDAWARASAGNASNGAAYLTLIGGNAPDEVVGVSAGVAASTALHESFSDKGVMKMRAAPSLPVPAASTVTLAPGGYHVMLMGLKQPLAAGQSFPLTVTFAHAAPVTVEVKVQAVGRGAPAGGHDQMH